MNPFKNLYDTKTIAQKFQVTVDYIGRILKGRDSFPEKFEEGIDYKIFGKTYIVSNLGLDKFEVGFGKIRNKSK